MKNDLTFDVVIIGGGHAGCEAAAASARLGVNTALYTHKIQTIGVLPKNESITVLEKSKNRIKFKNNIAYWYKIKAKKMTGWVSELSINFGQKKPPISFSVRLITPSG